MNIYSYEIDGAFLIAEFEKLGHRDVKQITGNFNALDENLTVTIEHQGSEDDEFESGDKVTYYTDYNVNSHSLSWYHRHYGTTKKVNENNGGNLPWKFIEFLKRQWEHNCEYVATRLKNSADIFHFPSGDLPNISKNDFKTRFRNLWCEEGITLMRLSDGKLCLCRPNLEIENNDELLFKESGIVKANYDIYSKEFAIVQIFESKFMDFVHSNFDMDRYGYAVGGNEVGKRYYKGGFSDTDYYLNETHPDYDKAKARQNIDRAFNGDII